MGLIKSNHPSVVPAATFSLADIEQQARAILARARAEADQFLAEAKRQGEALRVAAAKDGRAAGVVEGRAAGQKQGFDQAVKEAKTQSLAEHRAKLVETMSALTKAATALDARVASVDDDVRDELIRLALAIAARITRRTAADDTRVVEANVREAVRLTMDKSSVKIAVHPEQRDHLESLLPDLKTKWPTLKHVELCDDPTVGVGGCRVTSAAGEVDAAIDAQLERIAAELCPNASHPPSS